MVAPPASEVGALRLLNPTKLTEDWLAGSAAEPTSNFGWPVTNCLCKAATCWAAACLFGKRLLKLAGRAGQLFFQRLVILICQLEFLLQRCNFRIQQLVVGVKCAEPLIEILNFTEGTPFRFDRPSLICRSGTLLA